MAESVTAARRPATAGDSQLSSSTAAARSSSRERTTRSTSGT